MNLDQLVSTIESLPADRQRAIANRVYHVLDVRAALTGCNPAARTADLSAIDWQTLLQTLLADAPEILTLVQEILALTGG